MRKSGWVRGLIWLSIVFFLICLTGLFFIWFSNKQTIETVSEEKKTTRTSRTDIKIVALGDSLTRGFGDESGVGYVGAVTNSLEASGRQVEKVNLAVNGVKTSDLMKQLDQKEVANQIASANLILMTIGGNDLFRGGEAFSQYKTSQIETIQNEYLKQLGQIYTKIRTLNREAPIYHVALYNPFLEEKEGPAMSETVFSWNAATEKKANEFSKIICVPTYDLMQLNGEDYLASDHFHPNSEGYKWIGNRVSSVIKAGGE